jgi:hypothetical protein
MLIDLPIPSCDFCRPSLQPLEKSHPTNKSTPSATQRSPSNPQPQFIDGGAYGARSMLLWRSTTGCVRHHGFKWAGCLRKEVLLTAEGTSCHGLQCQSGRTRSSMQDCILGEWHVGCFGDHACIALTLMWQEFSKRFADHSATAHHPVSN